MRLCGFSDTPSTSGTFVWKLSWMDSFGWITILSRLHWRMSPAGSGNMSRAGHLNWIITSLYRAPSPLPLRR